MRYNILKYKFKKGDKLPYFGHEIISMYPVHLIPKFDRVKFSWRERMFQKHMNTCAFCGKKGDMVIYSRDNRDRKHFDLFSHDGKPFIIDNIYTLRYRQNHNIEVTEKQLLCWDCKEWKEQNRKSIGLETTLAMGYNMNINS